MKGLTARDPRENRVDKRKIIISVIIGSIIVHVVAGLVATIWIVAQYFAPPPATFEVKRDIRLPAQERQHAMNMAQFDAMTPKPSFTEKIASMRPTEFSLPDLPQVPMDQMLPLDPSELISDSVESLVGTAGFGAGGLGMGGLDGTGDAISFFGVQSQARRVLLLFDVSQSVVNKAQASGVPMERIRDETLELIDGLSINTRFGLIQFVRNHKPFRSELIPATDANKQAARDWVNSEWRDTGTMPPSGRGVVAEYPNGILRVLEEAFAMEPDVIYILSDGNFWRNTGAGGAGNEKVAHRLIESTIRDLQGDGPTVPIHFIGFEMASEDQRVWRRVTGRSGGQMSEM